MCLRNFFFLCKSYCKNVFSGFFKEREQFTDSAVAFNKTKRDYFKLQRDLMGSVFFPQRQLTNFEHCLRKESFIAIIYRR